MRSNDMQGAQYAAEHVKCEWTDDAFSFSLNISNAYPEVARVKRYHRTFTLDRASETLRVRDEIELTERVQPTALPLLLAEKPTLEHGCILASARTHKARITYNPTAFTASVQEIPLEDERLTTTWQRPTLYKVQLTRTQQPLLDAFEFLFSKE